MCIILMFWFFFHLIFVCYYVSCFYFILLITLVAQSTFSRHRAQIVSPAVSQIQQCSVEQCVAAGSQRHREHTADGAAHQAAEHRRAGGSMNVWRILIFYSPCFLPFFFFFYSFVSVLIYLCLSLRTSFLSFLLPLLSFSLSPFLSFVIIPISQNSSCSSSCSSGRRPICCPVWT